MTRKLNAFLRAAQVKRVCIVLDDFFCSKSTFTLLKSMLHTQGYLEEHVFSHLVLKKFMHIEHILYKHVGQVLYILQAGHLAVNKCNLSSGGRCGAGVLHSPGWPPGGQ